MAEESGRQPNGAEALLTATLAGASNNPKVDQLLDRQIALADLQIDDLKREEKFRHWSLRVHHISDVMKVTFEIAAAFVGIAMVIGICAALWAAAHDDSLIIESFSVPPDMTSRGLT